MSSRLIHNFIFSIYHRITRKGFGSNKWKKQFAYFGKGAVICWPAIVSTGRGFSIGDSTVIMTNSRIQNYDTGTCTPQIRIGKNCNIGYYFSILNASEVTIGDNVLIASYVLITSENHGMDPEELSYMQQPLVSRPVSIGDGCWIGEKVCVLPGVNIGKKCIIGAGSVVTKSIPDYSIAVGNPAKIIKRYNLDLHKWEQVNN